MLQLIHKMIQYAFAHFHACMLSIRNLMSTPLSSLLTIGAITLSLTLPILSFITLSNIKTLTDHWQSGSKITLYLQSSTTPDQAEILLNTLLQKKEIESGTYEAPDVLLSEFKTWSNMNEAIALLPGNPLPGVITLYPAAEYHAPVALKKLTNQLKDFNEVDHLSFDQEGMSKLYAILQLAEAFFFILIALIGLGMSFVIANTIRLALERHKEELEILTLLGATPAFIRRPFLYRGLWYGLLSALLSYGLVFLLIQPITPLLQKVATLYGQPFHLNMVEPVPLLILFVMSTSLGWLGAWIALLLNKKALV